MQILNIIERAHHQFTKDSFSYGPLISGRSRCFAFAPETSYFTAMLAELHPIFSGLGGVLGRDVSQAVQPICVLFVLLSW